MADARDTSAKRVVQMTELADARVEITSDQRLQVEFRIDDLISRLIPRGDFGPAACCGGCNGCGGCSM
jgi:hypothetical protein